MFILAGCWQAASSWNSQVESALARPAGFEGKNSSQLVIYKQAHCIFMFQCELCLSQTFVTMRCVSGGKRGNEKDGHQGVFVPWAQSEDQLVEN